MHTDALVANYSSLGDSEAQPYSTLDKKHAFASPAMFDIQYIQYIIKEWPD